MPFRPRGEAFTVPLPVILAGHERVGSSHEVSRVGGVVRGSAAGHEQEWVREFDDPAREWRRLFSEVLGTFLLVLAAVEEQESPNP